MESTVTVEPVAVEVRGLKKSFGSQTVLEDVSFSVAPGQIFCLMGPSGSGKSVLLRHLIGLELADAGEMRIDGQDASDPATHRKHRTSMVFQAGALLNSMTVFDNLALFLREHRLYDEAEIGRKVRAVMSALAIDGTEDKIPAELSGGMKKRVAVARAIIMEPQLILYDEPTSELDPILAATTAELIATVNRETKATSIVVTHDRDLALAIAGQIALLMEGRLVFSGTCEEIRACTDERVVSFLNPRIDLDNPRFRK